jgi:hypothetical protein
MTIPIAENVLQLFEDISKFITDRRKSEDDCYPEVSKQDITDLYGIIDRLIQFKCDPDCDGSYGIGVELINKNVERKIGLFLTVPHGIDKEEPFNSSGKLSKLTMMARTIASDIEGVVDYLQHEAYTKDKK